MYEQKNGEFHFTDSKRAEIATCLDAVPDKCFTKFVGQIEWLAGHTKRELQWLKNNPQPTKVQRELARKLRRSLDKLRRSLDKTKDLADQISVSCPDYMKETFADPVYACIKAIDQALPSPGRSRTTEKQVKTWFIGQFAVAWKSTIEPVPSYALKHGTSVPSGKFRSFCELISKCAAVADLNIVEADVIAAFRSGDIT